MLSHSFSVEVAKVVGDRAAIFLQHFSFWHIQNAAHQRHYHDGHYWTYNTIEAYTEQYPYLTVKQIRTVLERLEKDEFILTGNYNTKAMDHTKWYALTDKSLLLLGISDGHAVPDHDLPEKANRSAQNGNSICPNGQNHLPETAKPFAQMGNAIPDTNTDTNTDTSLPPSQKKGEADFENEGKNHPDEVTSPPGSGRPPSPPEQEPKPLDPEATERLTFTLKLQTDRRLLEGLQKLFEFDTETACYWIDRFVTTQWLADNLKGRRNFDLISHCQSWIKKELNEQQRQRPRHNSANNAGNGQTSSTGTGTRSKEGRQSGIIPAGSFSRARQNSGNAPVQGNGSTIRVDVEPSELDARNNGQGH
jgi:hypothetical protein